MEDVLPNTFDIKLSFTRFRYYNLFEAVTLTVIALNTCKTTEDRSQARSQIRIF